MKKRNILTLIATLTLTAGMLTGCGTELSAASVEVEVGTEVSDNVLDYITIEKGDMEEVLAEVKLNTENVDTDNVGEYTAQVIYKDETINVTVNVVDTTAPAIRAKDVTVIAGDTVTAEDLVEVTDASEVTVTLVKADGTETNNVVAETGMVVTVKAVDGSGNEETLEVTPEVIIPDTTAPVIDGVEDMVVTKGEEVDVLANVTATDETDGDLTDKIVVDGEVDVDTAGEYTIVYKVADEAGNETNAECVVTVKAPKKTTTKKSTTTAANDVTAPNPNSDANVMNPGGGAVVNTAPATPAPAPTPAPTTPAGGKTTGGASDDHKSDNSSVIEMQKPAVEEVDVPAAPIPTL